MRYNEDVINAETWNTGLRKKNLEGNKVPMRQKTGPSAKHKVTRKTDRHSADANIHRSYYKKVTGISRLAPSPASGPASRNRMSRRKKRGMILLSGMLTNLISGTRNRK